MPKALIPITIIYEKCDTDMYIGIIYVENQLGKNKYKLDVEHFISNKSWIGCMKYMCCHNNLVMKYTHSFTGSTTQLQLTLQP